MKATPTNHRGALDVLCLLMTGKPNYLCTVRVYDPADAVPKVPVRLQTIGYDDVPAVAE